MKQKYKDMLIAIIKKHVSHCAIYLFGSRAQKTHELGSDIDLALDAGEKLDVSVVLAILGEIRESTIPFFVDVVDLNGVSKEFRQSIEKDFELWTK